jgi:hypothetical protein
VIYSSIVIGACFVIAVAVLIAGGWFEARPVLGFLAAICALAYAAYFRPSVDVYADRAVLVNVVTIATVPFARLTSIGTRWALELRADDASKASAFAAPAPGAMKGRRVAANEQEWDSEAATLIYAGGPGTSTATASGIAAHMVDDAFQAWSGTQRGDTRSADASAGLGDRATTASAAVNPVSPETATASGKAIARRPNWLSIAALIAGLALLVLSF